MSEKKSRPKSRSGRRMPGAVDMSNFKDAKDLDKDDTSLADALAVPVPGSAPMTAEVLSGLPPEARKDVADLFAPGYVVRPHIDAMLGDAYVVLYLELQKLRKKAEMNISLTLEESKRMLMLSQQLAMLAKEEREQKKEERFDQMSNEDLEAAIPGALEALKRGKH